MLRRWLGPVILGFVLMLVAEHVMTVRMPRLLMAAAMHRVGKMGGGVNTMTAAPLATSDARAIVRPSPDLAYSTCPFDLSKGPLLVDVAPVPAPYWSLSVFDARTDVAFVRNNVQANGNAIHVALLGPHGGQAPQGYEPVPVASDKGIALVRILVDDRTHFDQIDAARRASACKVMGG
jgi:uncharacterized membrane protein